MRDLPFAVSRRDELLAAGWTARQVDHALRTGALHRLRRGVYTDGGRWRAAGPAGRHRVAATGLGLALAPVGGAVSHASAAALLGLPQPFAPTPVWGTVPRGLPTRYGTGTAVMAASLPDGHVRTAGRIRRTSAARTVADCMRHLTTVDAVAVSDAALRASPAVWGQVQEVLDVCAGWPYSRRGLDAWTLVDGRRESPLESWSWVAAIRQGLPVPEPQTDVYDEDGVFLGRVDAWWPEHGVVGEVDGLTKYGLGAAASDAADVRRAVQAVVAEKQREDLLRRTGLHVVRWGSSDLRQEPRWAQTIRTELGRGDPARVRAHLVPAPATHPLHPRLCSSHPHVGGRTVWVGGAQRAVG